MNTKKAIGLGVLCGLALGALGIMGAMFWMGGQMQDAKATAYDEGREYGYNRAQLERKAVSEKLNEMALAENEELAGKLGQAEEALRSLQARDDLTDDARSTVDSALSAIGG